MSAAKVYWFWQKRMHVLALDAFGNYREYFFVEIRLSSALHDMLRAHAERVYPEECVGALLGRMQSNEVNVIEVRPLQNEWQPAGVADSGRDRRTRYRVSPATMFALVREEVATGVSLVGFYHSHPDHEALPSGTDLQEAAIGYIYMIQSVVIGSSGVLTAWQIEDESSGFVEVDVKIV